MSVNVNYTEKLGLKQVINASGKMTILGVSRASEGIKAAQAFASSHFFEMNELALACSRELAKLLKAEDALVASSSASAIVLCSAAVVGKGKKYDPLQTPAYPEIVLPKGHNVDFGAPVETMIALGGGTVVEAGYANGCSEAHIEERITEKTAAIIYVDSHHCVQKSHLSAKAATELAHKHGLPIIIDAAAEEDLLSHTAMGADLVIYSGGKGINGPSSSSIIVGKRQYVEWVRTQQKGIGRAMKVSKETLLGTLVAVEEFFEKGLESSESQLDRLTPFIEAMNQIKGLAAEVSKDGSGRNIYRAKVTVTGKDAKVVAAALKEKSPVVYMREYLTNVGIIEFDIRSVSAQEMQQMTEKLKEIME